MSELKTPQQVLQDAVAKVTPIQTPNILMEANLLVNTSRQDSYGHPLDNFEKVAKLWSVIIGKDITPEQASLCLVALKISRYLNTPKRDNLVDIAGYALVTDMIVETRIARNGGL